eukprot:gene5170-biopygen10050
MILRGHGIRFAGNGAGSGRHGHHGLHGRRVAVRGERGVEHGSKQPCPRPAGATEGSRPESFREEMCAPRARYGAMQAAAAVPRAARPLRPAAYGPW